MFVARKSFMHGGVTYIPGQTIKGFPENFDRDETFIRGGFIVECPDPVAKKGRPKAKAMELVAPE